MQKINFTLIHGWGFADNFWLPLLKCLKNNKKYKLKFNIFNLGFFGEKKIIKTSRKNYINILITHSYGHCWFEKNQFPIDGLISFFYRVSLSFSCRTPHTNFIITTVVYHRNPTAMGYLLHMRTWKRRCFNKGLYEKLIWLKQWFFFWILALPLPLSPYLSLSPSLHLALFSSTL